MSPRKKHLIIFFITSGIFFLIFLFNTFENSIKREKILSLQKNLLIDLMANETQFDLLKAAPCSAIEKGSSLSTQMDEIGKKLTFTENIDNNKEVNSLKKYYFLLEVKDYLLSRELQKKCPEAKVQSIVYFYKDDCPACIKQGYVLSELKSRYPWLRIYSFDLDFDFPIITTLSRLYEVHKDEVPVLIINNEKHSGFTEITSVEKYIPELQQAFIEEKFVNYLKKEGVKEEDLSQENISCSQEEKGFRCTFSSEEEGITYATKEGISFDKEDILNKDE